MLATRTEDYPGETREGEQKKFLDDLLSKMREKKEYREQVAGVAINLIQLMERAHQEDGGCKLYRELVHTAIEDFCKKDLLERRYLAGLLLAQLVGDDLAPKVMDEYRHFLPETA